MRLPSAFTPVATRAGVAVVFLASASAVVGMQFVPEAPWPTVLMVSAAGALTAFAVVFAGLLGMRGLRQLAGPADL